MTTRPQTTHPDTWGWLYVAILIIATLAPILRFDPFTKPLVYDGGVFVYQAQEVAIGNAPYVSVFDHKTPLSGLIGGGFIAAGRLLGVADLASIRLASILSALIDILAIYVIMRDLTRSDLAALISGLILAGISGFADINASWLDPKAVLVTCEILLLLCVVRRKYVAAGIFATLCGLAWQPGFAIYAVAVLATLLQRNNVKLLLIQFVIGASASLAVFIVYLVVNGAFYEFWQQAIIFNFELYIPNKLPVSLVQQATIWLQSLGTYFGAHQFIVLLALPMLLFIPALITVQHRRWESDTTLQSGIRENVPLCFITLGALMHIGLSFRNVQGQPDHLPILPFCSLAWGLTIVFLMEVISGHALQKPGIRERLANSLLIIAAVGLTTYVNRPLLVNCPRDTLQTQETWVQKVLAEVSPKSIQVVGSPEFLVLAKRNNITPYLYFYNNVAEFEEPNLKQVLARFYAEDIPDLFVVTRPRGSPFVDIMSEKYQLVDQMVIHPDQLIGHNLVCAESNVITTQAFVLKSQIAKPK